MQLRRLVSTFVRYRHALALKPGEPVWDVIGGIIGSLVSGRARVELLVGADSIKLTNVNTGIVGLVSVGTER
jgi:hypothetical protein